MSHECSAPLPPLVRLRLRRVAFRAFLSVCALILTTSSVWSDPPPIVYHVDTADKCHIKGDAHFHFNRTGINGKPIEVKVSLVTGLSMNETKAVSLNKTEMKKILSCPRSVAEISKALKAMKGLGIKSVLYDVFLVKDLHCKSAARAWAAMGSKVGAACLFGKACGGVMDVMLNPSPCHAAEPPPRWMREAAHCQELALKSLGLKTEILEVQCKLLRNQSYMNKGLTCIPVGSALRKKYLETIRDFELVLTSYKADLDYCLKQCRPNDHRSTILLESAKQISAVSFDPAQDCDEIVGPPVAPVSPESCSNEVDECAAEESSCGETPDVKVNWSSIRPDFMQTFSSCMASTCAPYPPNDDCCQPQCDGKTCGPDSCGGICACSPGLQCTASGMCATTCTSNNLNSPAECCSGLTRCADGYCRVQCPTRHQLTVKKAGNGVGSVSSVPTGITCGGDCAEFYAPSAVVRLSNAPDAGSVFAGWSGACTGTGSCVVTMSQAREVTATFNILTKYSLAVTKDGSGTGTVSADVAGISCGGDCEESFSKDTVVALRANAENGSVFAGWSGACSGTGSCSVKMTDSKTVKATFKSVPVAQVTIIKSGAGAIFSAPDGIDCGSRCQASFAKGSRVTLSPSALGFSEFKGWRGAPECSGPGACTISISGDRKVEAVFGARPKVTLNVSKVGIGSGTVSVLGSKCASTCAFDFSPGSRVSATAQPDADSTFVGWGGACAGNRTCSVILDQSKSITATFEATKKGAVVVTKDGAGSGTVSSNPTGISCGGDCSETYAAKTSVELTAAPDAGSVFKGWSGACSGTGSCTISVKDNHNVTATFSRPACIGEGSADSGECCVGLTRCEDKVCKASCAPPCVGEDSNSPGACCTGLYRCSDGSCRKDCASWCVGEGMNQIGSCCSGLQRCADGFCKKSCPADCITAGSNAPGRCCSGLQRCNEGYCRPACTSCVGSGSNATGACCVGLQRCDDGYCKTSCPAPCISAGSNAPGTCCSGLQRCTDGYCRSTCSSPCIGNGSNGAGSCCSGLQRCNDGYCRTSCSAPCIPSGSNAIGACCSGLKRCDDGYCKSACPAPCVPVGSNAAGTCCPPAVRGPDGYCKRAGSTLP